MSLVQVLLLCVDDVVFRVVCNECVFSVVRACLLMDVHGSDLDCVTRSLDSHVTTASSFDVDFHRQRLHHLLHLASS